MTMRLEDWLTRRRENAAHAWLVARATGRVRRARKRLRFWDALLDLWTLRRRHHDQQQTED